MASPIPNSPGTKLAENHEHNPDAMESNSTAKLDPAVTADHDLDAAKEELRHTTISDKVLSISSPKPVKGQEQEQDKHLIVEDKEMREQDELKSARVITPEPTATVSSDAIMRERIASPKKKRGRETEDDAREIEDAEDSGSSPDGPLNGKRAIRSGPEKKRPRDASVDSPKTTAKLADVKDNRNASISARPASPSPKTISESSDKSQVSPPKATFGSGFGSKQNQTSTSAFASSGFASLASSTSSPFGTVGASKPSVFGSSANMTTSGFGGVGTSKSPSATATITTTGAASQDKPALGFGFGGGSTTSGFGGVKSGSVFGSGLGSGFGGGSGPKLSSFAAPVNDAVTSGKPTKAFGAPDSDEEEGSGDDDSDDTPDTDDEEGVKISPDEKKKHKASKVEDGESGEATLLQLRAKLFALESKDIGWKERGVGTLKINVPESCVRYDRSGVPLPGSYDVSGTADDDQGLTGGPRVPRLIMRQENTHRVVLNTIIVPAMEFKDKPSQQAAQILFTALEGEKEPKPISMLLKMSENNAQLFRSEIKSIQNQL